MLTKVKHPNVVLFFGVSFDDRDHDCYLVTEFCGRGNLQDFLAADTSLTRPLKLKMAVDVATGMDFLHQSDIIHRDLKSAVRTHARARTSNLHQETCASGHLCIRKLVIQFLGVF